jgi:hypothetical protein
MSYRQMDCSIARPYAPAATPRQPGPHMNLPWPLASSMAPLGALPTAPACARVHVKNTLGEWRMTALADTAELVTSELVTNAVRASTDEHGHPIYVGGHMAVILVRLLADRTRLVLEVWDMAEAQPAARRVDADAESGRGLELVAALAANWGWKTVPDWPGKYVWAELRMSTSTEVFLPHS